MKLSVVSPVYQAEKIIPILVDRIEKAVSTITDDYEIILVDDGSPDTSWDVVEKMAKTNPKILGIKLSRNFGQHYAITAGLDNASGDWVVVMDCDLQDQPEEIVKLYKKAITGFDIVLGLRDNRLDKFPKRYLSKLYYILLSYLTDSKIDNRVGSFRILSKKVVTQFVLMREHYRFFGAMMDWMGFKVAFVEIKHDKRYEGESTYTFKKSINLAVNGVLAFSDKPLRLTIKFGIFIVLTTSLFIFYKIVNAIVFNSSVIGWSSIIASIFFSTGIIVIILGVIGLYIGRIFGQVKFRPLYIITITTKTLTNG